MDDFPSVPREGGLDRCWNTLLAGQRPAVCHSLWSMETAPPLPAPSKASCSPHALIWRVSLGLEN